MLSGFMGKHRWNDHGGSQSSWRAVSGGINHFLESVCVQTLEELTLRQRHRPLQCIDAGGDEAVNSGSFPTTNTAGQVLKQREISNFSLSDTVYPQGLSLAKHRHENAYLSFVLSGSYTENYAGERAVCGEGTLRYLPACELHENEYLSGARCLLVRMDRLVLD